MQPSTPQRRSSEPHITGDSNEPRIHNDLESGPVRFVLAAVVSTVVIVSGIAVLAEHYGADSQLAQSSRRHGAALRSPIFRRKAAGVTQCAAPAPIPVTPDDASFRRNAMNRLVIPLLLPCRCSRQ